MRALLVVLLACATAFSQVVISVDENISRNHDKNLFLALGASAVLPGMGELYLGENDMVRPFVWIDATLWFVTLGSYFIGERYISSAHEYAVRHADLNTNSKKISILNAVSNYRSRGGVLGQNSSPDMNEDYNQAMIRSKKKINEEFDESIQWDWGSSDNPETTEHIEEYKNRLSHYRISRIVFQASVGALVLNRVIAVLNTMRIYRRTSSSSFANRIDFVPEFYENGSGLDVNVKF